MGGDGGSLIGGVLILVGFIDLILSVVLVGMLKIGDQQKTTIRAAMSMGGLFLMALGGAFLAGWIG